MYVCMYVDTHSHTRTLLKITHHTRMTKNTDNKVTNKKTLQLTGECLKFSSLNIAALSKTIHC